MKFGKAAAMVRFVAPPRFERGANLFSAISRSIELLLFLVDGEITISMFIYAYIHIHIHLHLPINIYIYTYNYVFVFYNAYYKLMYKQFL